MTTKKKEKKADNDGSFCAKSHNKMRAAGKDCRAAEDKDSPLCSARKKMNCRGKNEEKGQVVEKSEKLEINKRPRLDLSEGPRSRPEPSRGLSGGSRPPTPSEK